MSQIRADTHMKSKFFAVITILVSLLASLFFAELIVRLAWVPPSVLSTQQTEKHPVYSWAPIPGISGRDVNMEFNYRFNHTLQGLRGSTLFSAIRPDAVDKRILFLGDSFTYGIGSGDDEIFVELINDALPRVDVVNAGVNGYGQRQQLTMLDTLGAAVQPDLVVLMFFWTDVEDNFRYKVPTFSTAADGSLIRTDMTVPDNFDPLAQRRPQKDGVSQEHFLRRTYLFKLFKEGIRGFRHRVFGGRERRIQTDVQMKTGWSMTAELLRLMQQRTKAMGAQLIIASVPDYELVDSEQGRLKGQKLLNIAIETELRAVTDELGIAYLDLLPEMKIRQAKLPEPFYYTTDRHLTPIGNVELAAILLPFIKTNIELHDSGH